MGTVKCIGILTSGGDAPGKVISGRHWRGTKSNQLLEESQKRQESRRNRKVDVFSIFYSSLPQNSSQLVPRKESRLI